MQEIADQGSDVLESVGQFKSIDMFVVALAAFIVIADYLGTIARNRGQA